MNIQREIFLILILLAVAGSMRFAKLGDWSFDGDELFTTLETKINFGETAVPEQYLQGGTVRGEDTQLARLPKMLPLGSATHYLNYRIFGEDEFGSRVFPAIFGTLCVVAAYLFGRPQFGTAGALALAGLLLFWPAHLFHSQVNRYYIETFFFETLVFLLAGLAWHKKSAATAFFLGFAALGMILCHALTSVIWGIVLLGFGVAAVQERRMPPATILLTLIGWSLVFLAVAVFYFAPLAKGWNAIASWGYSPLHAVLALVNMLGFFVALLVGLGGLFALSNFRNGDDAFWTTCSFFCVGCCILLPRLIVFNPNYLFLFTFPLLVLATRFAENVFQRLNEPKTVFAFVLASAWLGAVCVANFPSLASYYLDGSRCDNREAFRYVRDHWKDGDRMTGYTMGCADWYAPEIGPKIPLRTERVAEKLQELADAATTEKRRLWIVLPSHRGGLDLELRRWLGENCSYEFRVGKKRFDYDEYTVEVFLFAG